MAPELVQTAETRLAAAREYGSGQPQVGRGIQYVLLAVGAGRRCGHQVGTTFGQRAQSVATAGYADDLELQPGAGRDQLEIIGAEATLAAVGVDAIDRGEIGIRGNADDLVLREPLALGRGQLDGLGG